MKINLPVTQNEHVLDDGAVLVSTTNLKGIITSTNPDFEAASGYSRDELVGRSHNVVRHPDMPPEAFADLWQHLKAGRPWMGIVKNRCKNGDHYWVDAFVAPMYENGQVVAYQSVRVKPDRQRVARAERLYARLRAGKPLRPRWLPRLGLAGYQRLAVTAGFALPLGLTLATGAWSLPLAAAFIVGLGVAAGGIEASLRPLRRLAQRARAIVDNPLMREVYAGRQDELGVLECALVMLEGNLATVIKRVDDLADDLKARARAAAGVTASAAGATEEQQASIEQIAAAVNEMSASIREVATSAASAAEAAEAADRQARAGTAEVQKTDATMAALAAEIEKVAQVVARLQESSQNIGSVLDVIRGIAEQTNLLALNAAIEAARAGEQGRGFAVVADEVRTLAQRTQESTQEIQGMIEDLQALAEESAAAMEASSRCTEEGVAQARRAGEAIAAIAAAVDNITAMNTQIATATEQQSTVAEDINANVQRITAMAQDAVTHARQASAHNEELAEMAQTVDELVRHSQIRAVR